MKRLLFFLLVAAGSTFAQVPGAKSEPAATNKPRADAITGRVFDADGQPLRGALVNVFKIGNNSVQGTATDAEGKFAVNNLSPGAYRVSAFFSAYVAAASANTTPYFVGDQVTLTLTKGGVITGNVVTAQNEPLVGASVAAQRVRDADGVAMPARATVRSAMTDDRGAYRLFGLAPGTYFVVVRNNAGLSFSNTMPEAPTYFPASTQDTAQEVVVSAGAEAAGIDIRFRGERGYAVSGTVSGPTATPTETKGTGNITVTLTEVGGTVANVSFNPQMMGNRFAVSGVPDGSYELRVSRRVMNAGTNEPDAYAAPLKVNVRGGDVTGLEVKLLPAAMITGRVTLEKYAGDKSSCAINRAGRLDELTLNVAAYEPNPRPFLGGVPVTPDAEGNFSLRDLSAGRWRLTPQLPSDFWYLKNMQLKSLSPNAKSAAPQMINVGQQGVTLAAGEKLGGLNIIVAEGAASVEGKVVAEAGATLPGRLLVHLLAVDAAADTLRSVVTVVQSDATFSFHHLAPGKYWLLARPAASAVGPENRAALRREAEAANHVITVTPCQRVKDFVLPAGAFVK